MRKQATRALAVAAIVISSLSGCAAVVIGGAAVSAVTLTEDKRTLGTQLDDNTTEARLAAIIAKTLPGDGAAKVNVEVYNKVVLLVGQARDSKTRQAIGDAARTAPNVNHIHNQIRIGEPLSPSVEAHDLWLASKVRTQLLADKRVDVLKIDVIVEDSEVFLMGLVTQQQANHAIDITRNISGVVKVVNIFEIL